MRIPAWPVPKNGRHIKAADRSLNGQTGTHLADCHIRAHSQTRLQDKAAALALTNAKPLRLAAEIPDPASRLHRGAELRIIRQMGVKAAGHREPRLQSSQDIRAQRLRQHTTRWSKADHRHGRSKGRASSRSFTTGTGRGIPVMLCQGSTGMLWVNHSHDRPMPMPQHRQAGLAGEAVQPTVLKKHHRILFRKHQEASTGVTPRPLSCGGRS